jgi:hypothetical protein
MSDIETTRRSAAHLEMHRTLNLNPSIDIIRICKLDSSIKRRRLFLPVGKESTAMQTNPHFNQLGQAVSKFKTCIQDLPESKFLQPINGWTPRDVLAHLIGWNWLYITGIRKMKTGEQPSHYSDDDNDYRNVNAKSLETHSTTDQGILLDELDDSFQALQNYLLSLDPDDWKTDFGVRFQGSTITIEDEIAEMVQDYDDHREEIQAWVKIQKDH